MLSAFNFGYPAGVPSAKAQTPGTATQTGGSTQPDLISQNPTAAFVGIIMLLVAIRVIYEVAS